MGLGELLDDMRPYDIKTQETQFMDAFCSLAEKLPETLRELDGCDAQPIDGYDIMERSAQRFGNSMLPLRRFWHMVRCNQQLNGFIGVLGETVVPHYGSYDTIPEAYRTRIEAAFAAADARLPEVG